MQWFVVKYRKPDGTMTEAEFEVDDKPALFKILAGKKITAVNIHPGRLSKRSGKKNAVSTNVFRGILAGVLVVCGVIAAWHFFVTSGDKSSTNVAKNDKKSFQAPVIVKKGSAAVEKVKQEPRVLKPDDPAVGPQQDVVEPKTESPDAVADTNAEDSVEKRLNRPLKSHREQLISMAIPSAPGVIVPPLPVLSDEEADKEENVRAELADIAKGFENELKIEEKDTDSDIERKELVAAGKEEFGQYIKDGYTLRKYVEALREKYNDDAEFLSEAQKIMGNTLEDPSVSDEECQAMKAKIDELLSRRGMQPLGSDYDLNTIYAEEAPGSKEENK